MSKLNKTTVETIKTVVIAVLVSGIIAFIAGNAYANRQHEQLNSVRAEATAAAQTETEAVKK